MAETIAKKVSTKATAKKQRGRPKKSQDQFTPTAPVSEPIKREKNAFEQKLW